MPGKKRNPPVTERQKRGVRLSAKLAPFTSQEKTGKRFGITNRRIYRLAEELGVAMGQGRTKKLPHSTYFRLVFKLDNYTKRPHARIFNEEGLDHSLKYQYADFEGFCKQIRGMKAYKDYVARIEKKIGELDARDYEHKDELVYDAMHKVEEEIFERNSRNLDRLIETRIQTGEFEKLSTAAKKRILRRAQAFTKRAGIPLPRIVKEEIKKLEK